MRATDELSRLRFELDARDRQETAIAELGQAALTGVDPLILLGQACALVELTLQVSHCRALELTPGGRMVVRAALGANETFLHCNRDARRGRVARHGHAARRRPVHVRSTSKRRRASRPRTSATATASAAAPASSIRTQYGPFGVLLVYSNDERTFTDYELAFLRSTANIVGEAIARARTEQALRKSEARLRQLIATTLDAVVTVDSRDARRSSGTAQAETMFGIAAREAIGAPLPPIALAAATALHRTRRSRPVDAASRPWPAARERRGRSRSRSRSRRPARQRPHLHRVHPRHLRAQARAARARAAREALPHDRREELERRGAARRRHALLVHRLVDAAPHRLRRSASCSAARSSTSSIRATSTRARNVFAESCAPSESRSARRAALPPQERLVDLAGRLQPEPAARAERAARSSSTTATSRSARRPRSSSSTARTTTR